MLQPNTFVNRATKELFCPDEIEPKEKQFCNNCNLSLRNDMCEIIHRKFVCRWGWFCLKCEQYTFRSKFLPKIEDIIRKHNCLQYCCTFCGENVLKVSKKQHLCPLQNLSYSNIVPRLAFLQMSFMGSGPAYCSNCKENITCTFCADNVKYEQPNIGTLFLEEQVGHFDSYTFWDSNFCNDVIIEKDILVRNYVPSYFQIKQNKDPKVLFNQTKTIKIKRTLFENGKSVLENFLHFFLTKNLTNVTLLINCIESNDLVYIIGVLIKFGFTPKILQTHNHILSVECPEICLRILDSQNYVNLSFQKAAEEANLLFHYFPKKWNKPTFFDFEGSCPVLSDYFNFEDTHDELEKKEQFLEENKAKCWKFREQLLNHTKQKTFLTATTVLSFISYCFEFQGLLANQTSSVTPSQFLHPMRRPLVTYSSFIYQLFLLHTKGIKMIRLPIDYQSSKGEIEFAEYLQYISPNHKFEYAWTEQGQSKKYLPICVPDIIDRSTSTLYFYNGCEIHSHNPEVCRFKRKIRPEDGERNKTFTRKIQKLQERNFSDIKKIKIFWQCDWQYQKRSNVSVKKFMKNIYTNPPPYRLNPQDAGLYLVLLFYVRM